MTKKTGRKWWRWMVWALATPPLLFVLLAIVVYLPPVQNKVVDELAKALSQSLSMQVRIDRVRLAFPLDLAVHNATVAEEADTLLRARALRLKIELLPLLRGRVNVDGLEAYDVWMDSHEWVGDARVYGHIGSLQAAAHGIDLKAEKVQIDAISLEGADVWVALSDTAASDTTTTPLNWQLSWEEVALNNTRVHLSLPGDSMRVGLALDGMRLDKGNVDLLTQHCRVALWKLQRGAVTYATRAFHNDGRQGNAAFSRNKTLMWEDVALPTTFSTEYVQLNDLSFELKDLHYLGLANMGLHIADMAFKEQSGWQLQRFSGKINSTLYQLQADDVRLQTPHSEIRLTMDLPWESMRKKGSQRGNLALDVRVGAADVRTLGAAFVDTLLLQRLPDKDLTCRVAGKGAYSELQLDSFIVEWDDVARMTADGKWKHLADAEQEAQLRFSLNVLSGMALQKLLPEETQGSIAIPSGMLLKGTMALDAQQYTANIDSRWGKGLCALQARWNGRNKGYRLQLDAQDYPLQQLLPTLNITPLTARLQAEGRGFDIYDKATAMEASIHADDLNVEGWAFDSVQLVARYAACAGEASFATEGDMLRSSGELSARCDEAWIMQLKAGVAHADLQQIAAMSDTVALEAALTLDATIGKDLRSLFAEAGVRDIRFHTPEKSMQAKDLFLGVGASADTTYVSAASGDLDISLSTQNALSGVAKHLKGFGLALRKQLENKAIDHYALKDELPNLVLSVDVGTDNPVSNVLRHLGYSYEDCRMQLSTDPQVGLAGYFTMRSFVGGTLQLDDIDMTLVQDTSRLRLNGYIHNYKKRNPNKFEAHLDLNLLNNGAEVMLDFADKDGNTGIQLGANARIGEGQMEITVTPERPVIAFRQFEINPDNYIILGKDGSARANVELVDALGTGMRLYGEPIDSLNDMTLSFYRVNLKEISSVLPYVPRVEGMLNSDFHVMMAPDNFSAMAMVVLDDLKYEEISLGDIGMEAVYMPKKSGEHYANAFVSANGEEVLALDGTYIDSLDGSFSGSALLTRFPLSFVNGFLAGSDLALSGRVGGDLSVNGTLTDLSLNGQVDFDSAHVYSDVYGFDFRLDDRPAYISQSKLLFDNYQLHSRQSNNPLLLNGEVDMTDFAQMKLDLEMQASNFELINAKRQRQSLLYGKLYADYIGSIKGTLNDLAIRGRLTVLGRTDMTYILKDSPLTVDDRLHDLVRFVNFEDSVEVVQTAEVPSNMDVTLGIAISDAARFHCDLSEDGENYVDIEGGGDLTMRMTPQGDMRLTGRFIVNSGEMKYSLPIIPLKTFTLHQGSYVDFTGDILNPTLNITATERMKATVTENDVPRTVAFDVGVNITQPLEKMGIEFIIDAPEDLSMQNQLATMTKEQRGKSAVALLATGMFINDDALAMGGSGFKANNALNAFLQSEIQNIAGSALKTIDVSIGMESGVNSVGASTTDYSFQFAKRFWGNRISVIVGGKVSTGENAENSAESFIDNVSVEYRLDKTASRYIRVFYDRGTHDPFEGQLMTTGAGLVLRRKTNKLGELFIFKSPKKDKKP